MVRRWPSRRLTRGVQPSTRPALSAENRDVVAPKRSASQGAGSPGPFAAYLLTTIAGAADGDGISEGR